MQLILRVMPVAAVLVLPVAASAAPNKINPAEYLKPVECAAGFEYDSTSSKCTVAAGLLKNGTECVKNELLEFKDNKCVVKSDKAAPDPTCKVLDGYKAAIKNGNCTYENASAVSLRSDYIGDCFTVNMITPGSGLISGHTYLVTSQGPMSAGSDDRTLTLVPGEARLLPWPSICAPKGPVETGGKPGAGSGEPTSPVEIQSSQMMGHGTTRRGWTYGVLTMPYKYFPGERSFQAGVPVGPYLGIRFGQAGSGWTVATAVTLGQVKGNTVDPKTLGTDGKPTVTGTTDLPALSFAGGLMLDILKTTSGKTFKGGFFFGQDRISNDPTTSYRYNRKNWIAVQLGFDFTDN